MVNSGDILSVVYESLEDGKAVDIVEINLSGVSSVADYFIIAGGTSVRHVSSLAERVLEVVRDKYGLVGLIEGGDRGEGCDWVIVDFGDIVVHLFRPEVREFYDLEGLWNNP